MVRRVLSQKNRKINKKKKLTLFFSNNNNNMKKRTGFVSNSSSSSFVIKKGEVFNDTREIAKYMLPDIDWMDENERIKFYRLLDNLNINDNITFKTTNYDTYIQYLMGYFFIETANNHNWGNKLSDSHVSELPPEFNDIIEYDNKPAWDDRYCDKDNHYTEKVCVDGVWYCPTCEGDLSRKLKIKKLINKK